MQTGSAPFAPNPDLSIGETSVNRYFEDHTVLFTGWLTWRSLRKNRFRSGKYTTHRRRETRQLGGVRDWLLEERCLLSGGPTPSPNLDPPDQSTLYVAPTQNGGSLNGPYTLQKVAAGPGSVIFLGGQNPNTGSFDWGNVPQKLVTFTNDSKSQQTIYPFLYSANTEKKYDPIDIANDEYRLYIGYQQDGKYILGLPFGQSITISVPLVFWNGGRADIATDGANLIPQPNQVNTLNPFQFTYTASTYITTQGVSESTDNGTLMYYKANTPGAPVNPSPSAQGQLTEWTIRDQNFLTLVNTYDQNNGIDPIPSSELTTLINYDVSYVDDMLAPVAMSATQVPVPIQYIQLGTAMQNGNTTTIQLNTDYASLIQLLTITYPYQNYQWQVKYNDPNTKTTVNVGTITNVSNGVVTVVNNGVVSQLPTAPAGYVFYTNAVTQDYGWTGANNDIASMQQTMSDFTTNNTNGQDVNDLGQYFGGLGWPEYYNPTSNALIKIPSGASILINSPLTTSASPYNNNYYLLTSGNNGNQALYNAHEDLYPTTQSTNKGDQVTFKVNLSEADLAAIKNQGGTWILTNAFNTPGFNNPIGTVVVQNGQLLIDPANQTITVTLNQTIPDYANAPGGYSYLLVAPPSDPYSTKLTNLWYSWAKYYVDQFSGFGPVNIAATVSADTDSSSDTRILTFSQDDWTNSASKLALGMTVSYAGEPSGSFVTILKIDAAKRQIYLSAPVPSTTTSFTFSKPAMLDTGSDPVQTNLIDPTKFNDPQFGDYTSFAKAFAATVYELLSVYNTIPQKHTDLPYRSMDVVYEAIGGNVGFLPTATYVNISADVRDLGKSALRGVPDFNLNPNTFTPDANWKPGDWYPSPSVSTDNAGYNVFNLDPFVWFVHQKLGLSGYGFSFDDDAADIGAGGASTLTVTYAAGAKELPIQSQWFPSTPWGAVQNVMATISDYNGPITAYQGKSVLTLDPQNVKAFWQVSADDKLNSLVGAYVSSSLQGYIPAGTNLLAALDSNKLEFVLSTKATATAQSIPITFTGYPPQTLSTSPPPAPSPPPPTSPPPSSSPGSVNSPTLPELVQLANDEFFLILDQVIALADTALGIVPGPTLESSIAAYQNAISANPADQTLLGQAVVLLTELDTLNLIMGRPTSS